MRHFYAAYVFDQAGTRLKEVCDLILQARQTHYPMPYWWLSEAMDLQDIPDQLIVSVHQPLIG